MFQEHKKNVCASATMKAKNDTRSVDGRRHMLFIMPCRPFMLASCAFFFSAKRHSISLLSIFSKHFFALPRPRKAEREKKGKTTAKCLCFLDNFPGAFPLFDGRAAPLTTATRDEMKKKETRLRSTNFSTVSLLRHDKQQASKIFTLFELLVHHLLDSRSALGLVYLFVCFPYSASLSLFLLPPSQNASSLMMTYIRLGRAIPP